MVPATANPIRATPATMRTTRSTLPTFTFMMGAPLQLCVKPMFPEPTRLRLAQDQGLGSQNDIAVSLAAVARAELAHDGFHEAPTGERALQQIGADERSEREPPLAHEHRAARDAQCERQQNEDAGNEADDLPRGHAGSP